MGIRNLAKSAELAANSEYRIKVTRVICLRSGCDQTQAGGEFR